jgi:methylglutaconyl-CoA hydratase
MPEPIIETMETIEIEHQGAVVWVWMNRPDVHNALNECMIEELTGAFAAIGKDLNVRVIVLSGRGRSFSAGADIESMKRQGAAPVASNLANARQLAEMFRTIANSSRPTIARVNGAAMGGGFGLVAACDIALAATTAVFAASEVRLGLIPSTISPYVLRAIGPRFARRLFLTGERIDSAHAERIGLVHEAVAPEQLDAKLQSIIEDLLAGAPLAQKAAKDLIDTISTQPITQELIEETATRITNIRTGPEAREGLDAFLAKRPAAWAPRQ